MKEYEDSPEAELYASDDNDDSNLSEAMMNNGDIEPEKPLDFNEVLNRGLEVTPNGVLVSVHDNWDDDEEA